jgi:3',5'-cyclic AMP phosphodiesterase CpdA
MTRWAATHRVDALVTTGDNVYPDGDPARFAAVLDAPYAELRRTRPLWVTLGNHDVEDGHGPAQLRHLRLPKLPYERRLGLVQLLFLDGNRVNDSQTRWLRKRLDSSEPRLRVVVFHQPAYSCSRHGRTRSVQRRWVPLLERARVTLVLSGHDHNYQRFTSPRGVTYVVTGGGGNGLYRVRPGCERTVRQEAGVAAYHFVGVETAGERLRLTAVSADGTVLDTAELPEPSQVGSLRTPRP